MASLGGRIVDCVPLLERLQGCNARPAIPWAHNNGYDLQAVADRISTLAKEWRLKLGKGKALVCAGLGAALVAARRHKYMTQQTGGETIKSLQGWVGALKKHLENGAKSISDQRTTNQRLKTKQRLNTALTEALEWEKIFREQLDEAHPKSG